MKVYLCSYGDDGMSRFKNKPAPWDWRERFKHRADMTEYPQYDFDNTLNNTKDFEPWCFIEVEP